MTSQIGNRSNALDRALLLGFGVFTLVAVAGYWIFVRTVWGMSLLGEHPILASIYQSSFPFFARANIAISIVVLAVMLWRRIGGKWLAAFAGVFLVSLGAELLGTTTGFPFGAYYYTPLLGPQLFGHVPLLIPISWFTCALPAFYLAARTFKRSRTGRILAGTFLLVLWDVTLDPAMSFLTNYWVWESPGPYYSMPLVNFLGWAATGLVVMSLLEAAGADRWTSRLPYRWVQLYYLLLIALPAGMCLAAGVVLPVLLTAVALALFTVMKRLAWSSAWSFRILSPEPEA